MAIPVRFATSAPSLGHISNKDFRFGVETGSAYAPTSTNLFWTSYPVPSKPGDTEGWVVYFDKGQTYGAQGPAIYTFNTDSELKQFLETHYFNFTLSSLEEGIASASHEDGICIVNRDYEPFVTDGLSWHYDASFSPSLASGSLTNARWFNLGSLQGSSILSGSFGSAAAYSNLGSGSVDFPGSGASTFDFGWGDTNRIYSPYGVMIWFWDDGSSDGSVLWGKGEEGAGSNQILIIKSSNGGGPFFKTELAGESTDMNIINYSTGQWNMLVINFGNSENQISINNSTLSSRSRSSLLSNQTSTRNMQLANQGGIDLFNGKVAIFSLYEGELTQDEIAKNWAAFRDRFGV